MAPRVLASRNETAICFAHPAYRMGERFQLRNTGIRHIEVRTLADLHSRLGEAAVRRIARASQLD